MEQSIVLKIMDKVIQPLLAAIFGFIIAYYSFKIHKRKKIIEYEIFSMALLGFKPKLERSLRVFVEEYEITGKEEDKGKQYPVENAYGFEILLKNISYETINNPIMQISFDDSAKILEFETKPISQPGYKIAIEKDIDKLNIIRFIFPYINSKEEIKIRIISTENLNRECKINILGPGIMGKPVPSFKGVLWLLSFTIFIIIALIISATQWFSAILQNILGIKFETKTETITIIPVWLGSFFIIILIIFFAIGAILSIKKMAKRDRAFYLPFIYEIDKWD